MALAFYKNLDEIDTISDKTFYGFKVDSSGDCRCEVMRTNDSAPIVLPENGFANDPDGYKQYFWSKEAITFRMNTNTGHLEMVIL
jgi:hypothetical protein|tara:strand:- start:24 stop:278 length:255 start_codon:yes stop_codon:yes gene_type:complete